MDILFFFCFWLNKRIRGLCRPPACRMMRVGGERPPHTPLPLLPRTLPKEHQSRHCCGTVGSFELSAHEEGARRWMAHRMKPLFSQPCGNVPPGLNNYSGTRGDGTGESWENIPWSSVSLSCWQGKVFLLLNVCISYTFLPALQSFFMLTLWAVDHQRTLSRNLNQRLLSSLITALFLLGALWQWEQGFTRWKSISSGFPKSDQSLGYAAAHNYLLFGWRRSAPGLRGLKLGWV